MQMRRWFFAVLNVWAMLGQLSVKDAGAQAPASTQVQGRASTSANAPVTPSSQIPVGLEVCMGACYRDGSNVGTWVFHGTKGNGHWPSGSVAILTVVEWDARKIVIHDENPPESREAGLSATYEGTLRNGRIDGIVTLKWPGHFKTPGGELPPAPWFATIPVTTCAPDLSGAESLEVGAKAVRFRQLTSAFQCFLKAAKEGDGQAKAYVGLMYRDGIGTSVDHPQAFTWLKAGAIQGDYNAQIALAQMYELGVGTVRDAQMAAVWKEKAENNPTLLEQKERARQQMAAQQERAQQEQAQQQQVQSMMFMGIAAILEAATRPDVYVVY